MATKTKPAASTKTTKAAAAEAAVSVSGLPEGFVSPFSRVEWIQTKMRVRFLGVRVHVDLDRFIGQVQDGH